MRMRERETILDLEMPGHNRQTGRATKANYFSGLLSPTMARDKCKGSETGIWRESVS